MLNQKFYWGTIRKAIVAFGNLFNNIHIDRKDGSGNVIQTLKVPLSYAPRAKFLARIEALPDAVNQQYQTLLPRMAFEMSNIQYDGNRKISLLQQTRSIPTGSTTTLNTQYAPTPYNVDITLYVYTKNQDDGLQIVEQILPFFNPDFNLSLNTIPQLGIKNDLPIILNSVSYEDDYEGDFSRRRAIIWTLNFTLKLNFYGPVNRQGIIRRTTIDMFNNPELTQKIQTYNAVVDPNSAVPGDSIDVIESFEDF